jgi:hypothetical protein
VKTVSLLWLAAAPLCLAGVDVRLDTGSPVHVVVPGQAKVALVVSNDGPAAARVRYEYRIDDGRPGSGTVEVAPSGSVRAAIPESSLGKLGLKRVEYRIGGEVWKRATLAYMQPTGPARGTFLFGIAYGAGPDNQNPDAALAMSLCGVNVARLHPSWAALQKSAAIAPDWRPFDQALAVHAARGIQAQVLLSGTPAWARAAGADKGGARHRRIPNCGASGCGWRQGVTPAGCAFGRSGTSPISVFSRGPPRSIWRCCGSPMRRSGRPTRGRRF